MENTSGEKIYPPYGSTSWYETFLDLNQRQKIDKVDLDFIRLNIVSSRHEYKVFKGLRFLGLIKEDGSATEKLENLRVIGEDFNKNLTEIIKEAYHDLLSTVVMEKAKPENVINYFVQKHEMGRSTAEQAVKVLVFFLKKAEIPVSTELLLIEAEKRPKSIEKVQKKKSTTEVVKTVGPTEGIEELKYGDIKIWLPKGDVDSVKKAIRFLEFHIKELESRQ